MKTYAVLLLVPVAMVGAWYLGTHVDLAGAFKPTMRETDGDVVARARVYVDTREGALSEAGDLLQARDEGKFDFDNVQGDLFELCRREASSNAHAPRTQIEEHQTLLKPPKH